MLRVLAQGPRAAWGFSREEQHSSSGACHVISGWACFPLCDMRARVLSDVTQEPVSFLAGCAYHFPALNQWSVHLFCQELDSKYFNPCRPYTWSLSQLLTSVAWTVHDPAKLCATKTAWMGADLALGLEFATPALID